MEIPYKPVYNNEKLGFISLFASMDIAITDVSLQEHVTFLLLDQVEYDRVGKARRRPGFLAKPAIMLPLSLDLPYLLGELFGKRYIDRIEEELDGDTIRVSITPRAGWKIAFLDAYRHYLPDIKQFASDLRGANVCLALT